MGATTTQGTGPGSAETPAHLNYNIDNIRKVYIDDNGNLLSCVELIGNKWVLRNQSGLTSSGPIIISGSSVQCDESGDPRGLKAYDFQCCRTLDSQVASGDYSFIAGGCNNTASGKWSHAEGYECAASDTNAHAEGFQSTASGSASHAEGSGNTASGVASHAEGSGNTASGGSSHAEGNQCTATNIGAHAEGYQCTASNTNAHAEGFMCTASGPNSHAEGNNSKALGLTSHAEGHSTIAFGGYSHAEGNYTYATGFGAHSEGGAGGLAVGVYSHSEGTCGNAFGFSSHAEYCSEAPGDGSHAEGLSKSWGKLSHSEGGSYSVYFNQAIGDTSHIENQATHACAEASHAEGFRTRTGNFLRSCTSSGTTITITGGDYTSEFPNGSTVTILASGTYINPPVPTFVYSLTQYRTTSAVAYNIGPNTTTFTIDSALPATFTASHCVVTSFGKASHAEGGFTIASGAYSHSGGNQALANHHGQWARASEMFAVTGDAQITNVTLMRQTTNATPAILTLNKAAPAAGNRFLIASGKAYGCMLYITAKSAADIAYFKRSFLISNIGGTTAITGTVDTIGADKASGGAGGWSVAVVADNANDALEVSVTGALATTINWEARLETTEVLI